MPGIIKRCLMVFCWSHFPNPAKDIHACKEHVREMIDFYFMSDDVIFTGFVRCKENHENRVKVGEYTSSHWQL